MKIENRTKALIRFSVADENGNLKVISLETGFNELSESDFEAVQSHPMFKDYVSTSAISLGSKVEDRKLLGTEKPVEEVSEEEVSEEKPVDVDLKKQNKDQLIAIAKSFEIEIEGLTKAQLIEAIEAKRG